MEPIATPSARVEFQATRDDAGIPHITADCWLDALYGMGYMHAVDRATQVFFARNVATGQAAARIAGKPELIETGAAP